MRAIRTSIICLLAMLLCACGFHLRNNHNWPPQFAVVNLQMPSLNTQFASKVQQLILSMQSSLAEGKADVYTIDLSNIQLYHDKPAITTSKQAITFNYTFITTLTVFDPKHSPVYGPLNLATTQPIIVNSDQIYSNTAEQIVRPMLEQRMISLLYDHLTSVDLHKALTFTKKP